MREFSLLQEDGTFSLSTREAGPSVRSLSGIWWNDRWQLAKILYAKYPDGLRKACVLVFWRVPLALERDASFMYT